MNFDAQTVPIDLAPLPPEGCTLLRAQGAPRAVSIVAPVCGSRDGGES